MDHLINLIEKLYAVQEMLLAQASVAFVRSCYSQIDWSSRLIGIVGPRGVGKTTMLLQHIKKSSGPGFVPLYLSADSVLLSNTPLFDLAYSFYVRRGGTHLFLDEIHRYPEWAQTLKSIYDAIPQLKIVFSGSSQLSILKGRADLARRAVIYPMAGLSFREFLWLEEILHHPVVKFPVLLQEHAELSRELSKNRSTLKLFHDYLRLHYFPYYRENSQPLVYCRLILSSMEKTLYEDVASLFNIQTENLVTFKQLLVFFSSITPGELSIHKLAKNLGKKDDTIRHYLQILHDTALLRFLPASVAGHSSLKAAEKIYFENPNLLYALCFLRGAEADIGSLRESFVINQLQGAGLIPVYSKQGDYIVEGATFEMGGPAKGRKQIAAAKDAFVVSDDMLISTPGKIPLYLLGLLY